MQHPFLLEVMILTFQFLCKVVLTMQNHFEETSKMEAGLCDSSLENGSWFWHFISLKNLKGILSFKGLESFSFQLLSGTILAPESQYSFATTKKMESVTVSLF